MGVTGENSDDGGYDRNGDNERNGEENSDDGDGN